MIAALAGLALPIAAWALLRQGRGRWRWLALDAAPLLALGLVALAITARPLLSGAVVAAVALGLLAVERAKRAALGEGLVFTDSALLPMVARHPSLYLPFLPRGVLPAAVIGGALGLAGLLWLEPPRDVPRLLLLDAALALLVLLWRADRLGTPCGDPDADAVTFGPLATLALHRAVAARERPARQAAYPPMPARLDGVVPHLVVVQCESFCDPRRCAGIAAALPHWDRLGAEALMRGPLNVPGHGANTMRTEFAVLSGASPEALGLDRLNPYARFARRPVHSLAHRLAGHEAHALHPFDRRFFGRDMVLPALGFARFDAAEAFAGAPRAGRHVADAALGARIVAALSGAEAPAFMFAITMQAHGPWGADGVAEWLGHIADTDRMLGAIAAAAAGLTRPLVLVAYGDHRPALAAMRDGQDTDYLIWRSDHACPGNIRALDAHALHGAILTALATPGETSRAGETDTGV